MCGIVAVLRRRPTSAPPELTEVLREVERAHALLAEGLASLPDSLPRAAEVLEAVDAGLRGLPGIRALLAAPDLASPIDERAAAIEEQAGQLDGALDRGEAPFAGMQLEAVNAALLRVKDAAWAIRRDRLPAAVAVGALVGPGATAAAIEVFASIHLALSAIDRLEVRGRDSAGLHLLVTGHALDVSDPEVQARGADRLFTTGAVRVAGSALSFVYKAAEEIGELGDNTRALRDAIAGDALLRRALACETAEAVVLGHTRWASVGIISEPNAHPLNQEEVGGEARPYAVAALNGDIDNELELRRAHGLQVAPEITTDAKLIPVLMAREMERGSGPLDAFRRTVASFQGSVAIAASTAAAPDDVLLALRGSGQGLYIGLADDAFVVTSEPYGLVEATHRYVRMDGEATGGQVIVLDRARAGDLAGITRLSYEGTPLPVTDDDVATAEITTRDIDRAGFPHFLLKEISEAPRSVRKTLRGRLVEAGDHLDVSLSEEVLPASVRERLRAGAIRRVLVIGQGTAAIAGQAVAFALGRFSSASSGFTVTALPATELSGFALDDDMSDALVVAISQSGTTTDTNRTVDLVRARGASVVAIVNRRNSDLVEKADGVLYTSDGRDVEMSVASTKAFYAQVAAGFLLAVAVGRDLEGAPPRRADALLRALRDLPDAMERVLEQRPVIADAAQQFAPARRHWAVVGNGGNRIAAQELRIKLSELCYKSIACDVTEDKKHIDLSSEPLIVVCATGLDPSTASDVAKEVAIYRAHKAAPVVIATEGTAFPSALTTITVPRTHADLAFVLSAMAGHLFGYEAALAIDGLARPLREARRAVQSAVSEQADRGDGVDADDLLARVGGRLEAPARVWFEGLRSGSYNGSLEAATAVRLASTLRYAIGLLPLEAYELEYARAATPGAVLDELTSTLTRGIEELTRPVDAIKHQAKTVTVGISRSEDPLFEAPIVVATRDAGAARDRLSYRVLRTLAALGPAVEEVTGYTRYRVEGTVGDGSATIHVVDKGGIARDLASRAEQEEVPRLRGTKHRAATLRDVVVAVGARDGRTVIIVPETKDTAVVGITLLHARFADRIDAASARAVLEGYQQRYAALVDAVTETEPRFDDARLADVPIVELLVTPVHVLAERWR